MGTPNSTLSLPIHSSGKETFEFREPFAKVFLCTGNPLSWCNSGGLPLWVCKCSIQRTTEMLYIHLSKIVPYRNVSSLPVHSSGKFGSHVQRFLCGQEYHFHGLTAEVYHLLSHLAKGFYLASSLPASQLRYLAYLWQHW